MTISHVHVPAHNSDGAPQPGTRVLVEEPNADVCELIVSFVRSLGCEPLVRSTPEDGGLPDVELIIAEPASVGAQRIFNAHDRCQSQIPIVCVSIYPRETALLPRPIAAYLVKPFSTSALQVAMSAALQASA